MDIWPSFFPYEDFSFLICPLRQMSRICHTDRQRLHHLGLKTQIPEPQTSDRSRTAALSAVSSVGNFLPTKKKKSSGREKFQSHTNTNILGFLYIHAPEARYPKKKLEVRRLRQKVAPPHWANLLRRSSPPV